jgi:hypothetical protein
MPFHALGPLDTWMKKVNNDLTPARKVNPRVSERTDKTIRRAMDPDPAERPASCAEFIDDLSGKSARQLPATKADLPPQELWYLMYKDEEGTPHLVKGSVSGIRRSLSEGLLGDAKNVKASRTKVGGSFKPLQVIPEFRDLLTSVKKTQIDKQAAVVSRTDAGKSSGQKRAPHIPIGAHAKSSRDWIKWVVIIGLTAAAAAALSAVATILLHR